MFEGHNVVPEVHAVLNKMAGFAEQLRSGAWKGSTGKPIRNVVNIGIGGSDLGPVMAYEALKYYSARPDIPLCLERRWHRFRRSGAGSDPAETLFIVCSKTFTTLETLTNARPHATGCLPVSAPKQAVARTLSPSRPMPRSREVRHRHGQHVRVLGLGRRTLLDDSAIGLSTMLAVGPENFRAHALGLHQMDEHFRTAPFERNLPVLMGLLGVWYNNFFGA